ncbi:uncharacterized protein LOC126885616 [Diabrotica virgifera virgifera]|uniref:Uncharacterized protein n=1 Tax=Diabrotica virgifera virgifera TaxID=50390 RepID=A0ABM5KDD4_DIAVI|nr:uncharacterized protein LOC126885616 [Diabrotica virgifera virgifera]
MIGKGKWGNGARRVIVRCIVFQIPWKILRTQPVLHLSTDLMNDLRHYLQSTIVRGVSQIRLLKIARILLVFLLQKNRTERNMLHVNHVDTRKNGRTNKRRNRRDTSIYNRENELIFGAHKFSFNRYKKKRR